MPRTIPPPQSTFPYHIVGRCLNREWFALPMDSVWDLLSEQLYFMHSAFNVNITSFVLMSNHFHMIASTPEANLAQAMQYFMRESSREIGRQAGRINQTWGGPFFRCLLTTNAHYLNAYKYVYRNPVRTGVWKHCEEYPYTSLRGLLGFRSILIPLACDDLLFSPGFNSDHLKWLNVAKTEDELEIGLALRKRKFAFQKTNKYANRPDDFIY